MWYEKYINVPYSQCNCAQLLKKVWEGEFQHLLEFNNDKYLELLGKNNNMDIESMILNHSHLFNVIDKPIDKCAVLMYSRSGVVGHVGVYVDIDNGYILHAHRDFRYSVMQPKHSVFFLNPLFQYLKI